MSSNPDIAISVRGLSKKYSIAHQGARATTAAEALASRLRNPIQKVEREEFWALKDVSFDVHRGDVVGIIGRNGAGKSTLLKVLSRITEPTRGEAILHGRVGSLLEVGTGFHPELTGRENIYLNGAILGMTRAEITRQFDAIVDFSGTEKFLDTPVKRYSSGMYVRLAFAVAAHLSPEILIIDEVLAVGDAEFQKKCLGKMEDVSKEGHTVLFVSHHMSIVNSLCSQCIFLQKGTVKSAGKTSVIVSEFMQSAANQKDAKIKDFRAAGTGADLRFEAIVLNSEIESRAKINEPLTFDITVSSDIDESGLSIGCSLFSSMGNAVGTLFTEDTFSIRAGETKELQLSICQTNIAPGNYTAGFSVGSGGGAALRRDYDIVIGTPAFEVLPFSDDSDAVAEWNSAWGQIMFRDNRLKEMNRL